MNVKGKPQKRRIADKTNNRVVKSPKLGQKCASTTESEAAVDKENVENLATTKTRENSNENSSMNATTQPTSKRSNNKYAYLLNYEKGNTPVAFKTRSRTGQSKAGKTLRF
jgi:hypothetical protein